LEKAVVGSRLTQGYKSVRVIRDLDIEVGDGVTGLLGPNGAGKTTLLRTICTLQPPKGGSLTVLGLDTARPSDVRQIRARIGYLPQSFGYYPSFSVRDFVEYAAWLKKVPRNAMRDNVTSAIGAVGLTDRARSPLRSLSGGMLRRAGIAHAIVHNPDLLVLDEPTAGLDPEQRIDLRSLVRSIGERASVIISTHLVEDVRAVAGQVRVLEEGALVFDGTPTELEAAADAEVEGDSPIERGYRTVLGRRRADSNLGSGT
jgi:ABC-2 type transport system ATP-binding protein